jgi:3-deoxy-D-manno-octulosonate 8-phosphate phosphatase (KDO 8-P phosphatase)
MNFAAKAAKIEAIVFDVDGVLTRGDIFYGPGESEWKAFNVQDGHGFILAHRGGLKSGILTARVSEPVERRAKELQVTAFLAGKTDKAAGLRELAGQMGVEPALICYVGDDLVDLPAMLLCGFPVAVANAVQEVKDRAVWVTASRGGEGAAREIIETVLKAKGLWKSVIQRYTESR